MSVLESWVPDRDAFNETVSIIHRDHATDEMHIEYRGKVDNIIEVNKEHAAILGPKPGFNGNGQTHMARIHPVVWWELMKEGIHKDPPALKKWLNDPANRCFRTHPGRV